MTQKFCTNCDILKHLHEFRKDATHRDGYQTYCRECAKLRGRTEYVTKYQQRVKDCTQVRRSDHLSRMNTLKTKCSFCNEVELVCLAFHHKDPSQKDFTLSGNSTLAWIKVEAEIAKCIVVCHNCHCKIHAGLLLVDGALPCLHRDIYREPRKDVSIRSGKTNSNLVAKERYYLAKNKLNIYRKILGCGLCPEKESVCLAFHHKDPSTKAIEISIRCNGSWQRLENELTKCVVLCSNCHAKAHAGLLSIDHIPTIQLIPDIDSLEKSTETGIGPVLKTGQRATVV